MSHSKIYDVLIIGGGPAGLAAATGLARLLHSVVLFDSGVYRNARSKHMHAVVTWDHQDPADFRAAARKDLLARYNTTQFEDVRIESIFKNEKGLFEAIDAKDRKWIGRKVVLATGVRDIYPDIEGYDECWTTGIFHCLFCHGYETRDQASVGVLAITGTADPTYALHFAHNATQLAKTVTIYTNASPSLFTSLQSSIPQGGRLKIDDRRITKLVKGPQESDVIMHFADGSEVTEGFLVHKPAFELNGPFATQLGCELTPAGDLKVSVPLNETSVPGVFAAGDCSTPIKAVVAALMTGTAVSAGLCSQLEVEGLIAESEKQG